MIFWHRRKRRSPEWPERSEREGESKERILKGWMETQQRRVLETVETNVDLMLVISITGVTCSLLGRTLALLCAAWITGDKRVNMGVPIRRLLQESKWLR